MHDCPDCYEGCYCGGDIDDMLMDGTVEEMHCTHCADDERDEEDADDTHDIDLQVSGRWEKG